MNTAEVLNTPGYYYAIAYALSVFVIACTNERKLGEMEAGSSKLCSVCPPFIFYDRNRWRETGTVYSINDGDRRTTSWIYLYM